MEEESGVNVIVNLDLTFLCLRVTKMLFAARACSRISGKLPEKPIRGRERTVHRDTFKLMCRKRQSVLCSGYILGPCRFTQKSYFRSSREERSGILSLHGLPRLLDSVRGFVD